jgi:hypothetical protein
VSEDLRRRAIRIINAFQTIARPSQKPARVLRVALAVLVPTVQATTASAALIVVPLPENVSCLWDQDVATSISVNQLAPLAT